MDDRGAVFRGRHQKDLVETAANDYSLTVSHDSTVKIGNDRTITVDGNQTTDVGSGPLGGRLTRGTTSR